jgi:hypothetical protein
MSSNARSDGITAPLRLRYVLSQLLRTDWKASLRRLCSVLLSYSYKVEMAAITSKLYLKRLSCILSVAVAICCKYKHMTHASLEQVY